MPSDEDIRHHHFAQLYFAERSRREAIRGSIGVPVAAISFAVFSLGNLAVRFQFDRWLDGVGPAIVALAVGAVAALLAATWYAIMVEWLFVYHEPPGIAELMAAERAGAGASSRELLTAGYAVAYEQYLCGNALSARNRARALRLVLIALMLLAFAFLLIPVHLAGA